MKRNVGAKVHTNLVYSSTAHGEAFKVITPRKSKLKWAARTATRVHPNGRLRRYNLNDQEA